MTDVRSCEAMMNEIEKALLEKISNLHKIPSGAFSIRRNGKLLKKSSTTDIDIEQKQDGSGIDVFVKPNVKNKSLHMPVIITIGGLNDLVYNSFYIGENADVTIIAGCGIHNSTCNNSQHNGVHTFHLAKNSKLKYIEIHVGEGDGVGAKILNPTTNIFMDENSEMEIETIQIEGVTSTLRKTNAELQNGAKLLINEKLLTCDKQRAKTDFKINLVGKNSKVEIVSRSVAKENSFQEFKSNLVGKSSCFGHVECDGIVLDKARVISIPKIDAQNCEASLVHEALIGKIAGDEIIKLMTLGLDKKQAEDMIINSFLLN